MSKVAEVTPMDIKFHSKKKEQEFVNWANDNSTANQEKMVKMRKKIHEARKIKNGFDHKWKKQ